MKKVAVFIAFSLLIFSCKNGGSEGTMVLATGQFNGVFSPFFATTAYDTGAVDFVVEPLLRSDRNGEPIDGVAAYAEPQAVVVNGKNITKYVFKIRDGVKFSDGSDVTADDVIFSCKVFLDPAYDGAGTLWTTPIVGAREYRYDDEGYAERMAEIAKEAAEYEPESDEIAAAAARIAEKAGLPSRRDFLRGGKQFAKTLESVRSDRRAAGEKAYFEEALAKKEFSVNDIAGIRAVDAKTVEVEVEGVDPKAIWNLGGIPVVPSKYYGEGFRKGDLSGVKAKNSHPVGTGPFKFAKYENNIVTLERNELHSPQQAKFKTLKIQVVAQAAMIDSLVRGDIDESEPAASPETVEELEKNGLFYLLADNLGYGYIGINADRVTDKNVRKALMCLMNRRPAVETYYGNLASVIERPMSRSSWAYPQDSGEVYPFNPRAALAYFEKAGYVQENGVLQKDGEQLRIEIGIAGDGTMNHPAAPILTQMKDELEKLGGILEINDCDGNILFDRLDSGQWDAWVAAWSLTIDPDMYQTYFSTGPSNHYRIRDGLLDELILNARKTFDKEARRKMYSQALGIVMEEAVVMPVYQRKNIFAFNPDYVDVESLAKDLTAFYGWTNEIENVRMTK